MASPALRRSSGRVGRPGRRVVAAALVAVALALAGCGAAGPAPSAPSVTPAAVPDDETTTPPPTAWRDDDSTGALTVSPAVLAETHRRALANTTATLRIERILIGSNGSFSRGEQVIRLDATGATPDAPPSLATGVRVLERRMPAALPGRVAADPVFVFDNDTVRAVRRGDRVEYASRPRTDPEATLDLANATLTPVIRAIAAAFDGSFTADPGPNRTLSASRLTAPERLPLPRGLTTPRQGRVTIHVVDGVVRVLRLRYVADVTGYETTVRVTITLRVDAIGTTTVPTPDWVDSDRIGATASPANETTTVGGS